eukprot:7378732-Prymnesium_polylepis.3
MFRLELNPVGSARGNLVDLDPGVVSAARCVVAPHLQLIQRASRAVRKSYGGRARKLQPARRALEHRAHECCAS